MGVYLEKLTFNSRLDNLRKHVVRVHAKYRYTNSVSSKLLQLATVALLAWLAAHCALWKSESLSQGLGLSKTHLKCGLLDIPPSSVRGLPERGQFVSQVLNDANLSYKDKIRCLKALTVD